jgi:hypothetical protein
VAAVRIASILFLVSRIGSFRFPDCLDIGQITMPAESKFILYQIGNRDVSHGNIDVDHAVFTRFPGRVKIDCG